MLVLHRFLSETLHTNNEEPISFLASYKSYTIRVRFVVNAVYNWFIQVKKDERAVRTRPSLAQDFEAFVAHALATVQTSATSRNSWDKVQHCAT